MQPEKASAQAKARTEDELEVLRPLIEDGRSEEEQDEFLRNLAASIDEGERGYTIDSSEVFAKLRAQL